MLFSKSHNAMNVSFAFVVGFVCVNAEMIKQGDKL